MRSLLCVVALCLAVGCGPNLTGTWGGTISASNAAGQHLSYADTWSITEDPQQRGSLQILTMQTCTKWTATQGGSMATWAVYCDPYSFAGTMQLSGSDLALSFTVGSASATGLLKRQ